jgi:hypothetical protein
MYAALQSTDLTKLGLVVIVGLLVVGVLLSLILTALVARIIILVVVVGLAVLVWQQRSSIKDDIDNCHLSRSFFGITVHAPQSVVNRCKAEHKT